MAIVRKKIKGKEYLYEVRYENGKHKWIYLGKVTNESKIEKGSKSEQLKKESHRNPLVITRSRVQIPPAAYFLKSKSIYIFFHKASLKPI